MHVTYLFSVNEALGLRFNLVYFIGQLEPLASHEGDVELFPCVAPGQVPPDVHIIVSDNAGNDIADTKPNENVHISLKVQIPTWWRHLQFFAWPQTFLSTKENVLIAVV